MNWDPVIFGPPGIATIGLFYRGLRNSQKELVSEIRGLRADITGVANRVSFLEGREQGHKDKN